MAQVLTVTYVEELGQEPKVEGYRLLPVDLVAFERKFKVGPSILDDDPHMEHVTWLAWTAGRRAGMIDRDYEIWLPTVADVEDLDAKAKAKAEAEEGEAPDPL